MDHHFSIQKKKGCKHLHHINHQYILMYTDSIENWLSSFEEIFSFDKEILDSKYEDFNLNEGVNVSSESDGDQTILTKSNVCFIYEISVFIILIFF